MSGNLPEPDPALGSMAAEEAAQARRDALAALSSGDMDLHGLFAQEAEESAEAHKVIGHMHVRAALLALPHIGETRADEIISQVEGVEGNEHIAALGSHQREKLINLVEQYK